MTQTQAITQTVLRDVVGCLNRCPRQAHPRSEREKSIMRTVIIAASAATALFSSPAFTQQPSQATPSIPDFSGIWAHLAFPDVEPPLSGAGAEPFAHLHRCSPHTQSL